MTLLVLNNVTMSHHDLEQLSGLLSSCSDLEELDLDAVICNEQSHSCCIPVLDLQKHNKLKKLVLKNSSFRGLLLPIEGVRFKLELTNVTMTHHGLEQLSGSLSSCSDLVFLSLDEVRCNELSHSCCLRVLDLHKHYKLKKLMLKDLPVGGLLLPVEGARITLLNLNNVTMTHFCWEQLVEYMSSFSTRVLPCLYRVRCSEHIDGACQYFLFWSDADSSSSDTDSSTSDTNLA